MCILFAGENLRVLRLKSSRWFLNPHPPATLIDNIFTYDLANLKTSMQSIYLFQKKTDHFQVAYINAKYPNVEKEITVLTRISTSHNGTLLLNAV